MDDGENEDLEDTKSLVSAGAEIAGAAIGGALGILAAGPAGSAIAGVAGVAAAKALSKVGNEVAERFLGPREKVRVGGVIALAASSISERVEKGETLRSDGFFDSDQASRSGADETIESALLKAQREAEEKKLPYISNIITESAFNRILTRPLIQQILKISDALTYNQFCLLRLFAGDDTNKLEPKGFADREQFPFDLMQTLYETFDLYSRGLVSNGGEAALSVKDIIPGKCRTQGLGKLMNDVMGLNKIPNEDLMPLIKLLGPQPIVQNIVTASKNYGFGSEVSKPGG